MDQLLKPCPFCGSLDLPVLPGQVRCLRCQAQGPLSDSPRDAWNERSRLEADARLIIQSIYDRLVVHWGNDGSSLEVGRDYVPDLNLIRDMYRWLHAIPSER